MSYCYNLNNDIWKQDIYNETLFNRVTDILSQRINQIDLRPDREDIKKNQINKSLGLSNINKVIGNYNKPNKPNDNYNVKSKYNPHELLDKNIKHDKTNLLNIDVESELKTLHHYLIRDYFTETDMQYLINNRYNKSLNNYFIIENNVYPEITNKMFNNITKVYYNTIDTRNEDDTRY